MDLEHKVKPLIYFHSAAQPVFILASILYYFIVSASQNCAVLLSDILGNCFPNLRMDRYSAAECTIGIKVI